MAKTSGTSAPNPTPTDSTGTHGAVANGTVLDTSTQEQVDAAAQAEPTPPAPDLTPSDITPPDPATQQAPTAQGSTSIFQEAFGAFIEELHKRFDDAVPVKVLAELAPFVLSLHAVKQVDVDLRMQMQSRFDDALRRLGLV